jgi:hypothetical protein
MQSGWDRLDKKCLTIKSRPKQQRGQDSKGEVIFALFDSEKFVAETVTGTTKARRRRKK